MRYGGGGQFDRQGKAVNLAAKSRNGIGIRFAQSEAGVDGCCSFDEELHRGRSQCGRPSFIVWLRNFEGRDAHLAFIYGTNSEPAGQQQAHARTQSACAFRKSASGFHNLLAPIQNEHTRFRAQRLRQRSRFEH